MGRVHRNRWVSDCDVPFIQCYQVFFFTLIEMGEFVYFIGYFNLLLVIIVCKKAKETAKY